MKRLLIVLVVVLLFVSTLSITAYCADYSPDEGQEVYEPKFWDILFLPSFPDTYYNEDNVYKVILRRRSDNNYFLFVSSKEPWHINYYDSLVLNYSFSGLMCSVYRFDPLLDKKIWEECEPQRLYGNPAWGMRGHDIIYSNFDIRQGYSSPGGNVYRFANSQDYISITLALSHFQSEWFKNVNLLVPVALIIFSMFVLVKIIRKMLNIKRYTNFNKIHLRKNKFKKFKKRRLQIKWLGKL